MTLAGCTELSTKNIAWSDNIVWGDNIVWADTILWRQNIVWRDNIASVRNRASRQKSVWGDDTPSSDWVFAEMLESHSFIFDNGVNVGGRK